MGDPLGVHLDERIMVMGACSAAHVKTSERTLAGCGGWGCGAPDGAEV